MKINTSNTRFIIVVYSLLLGFVFAIHTELQAQIPQNINGWYPNGSVLALGEDANHIYMGGRFNKIVKHGEHGLVANNGLVQTTGVGKEIVGFPTTNGIIRTAVPDGAGGWYIGGDFTSVGGYARNRIARVKADKTVDTLWNPNANNEVRTILLAGEHLYIGGLFTTVGVKSCPKLVRVQAMGEGKLDTTWNVRLTASSIDCLALSGNKIFAGGEIQAINNPSFQLTSGVVRINTTGTGTADLDWFKYGVNATIRAMVISNGFLYMAGFSNPVPNSPHYELSRVSIYEATAKDPTWKPNPDNLVRCLLTHNGDIYAGGDFSTIGGQSRKNVAKIIGSLGIVDTNWNAQMTGVVYSMCIANNALFVAGGTTKQIQQKSVEYLVKLSISTGKIDPVWSTGIHLHTIPTFITAQNGTLLIATNRENSTIGGIVRNRLVRFHKHNLALDLDWNPNVSGIDDEAAITALLVADGYVYVGGGFGTVGGHPINNFARISTTGTGAVDTNWKPNVSGTAYAIIKHGNDLFIGGSFLTYSGVARIPISTGNFQGFWSPSSAPSTTTIRALAVHGNTLLVGGFFGTIYSAPYNHLVKVSLQTSNLITSWTPAPNSEVFALAVSGDDVYVGGSFGTISGQSKPAIAKINALTGNINPNWNPNVQSGNILGLSVGYISLAGDDVFFAGAFAQVGGQARWMFAKTSSTGVLSDDYSTLLPAVFSSVTSMHNSNGTIYVGGYFVQTVNGRTPSFCVLNVQKPEINLQSNNQNIVSGSNVVSVDNNTNMGSTHIMTTLTKTYTIQNLGNSPLRIDSIRQNNTASFSIGGINFPIFVPANSSQDFTITFHPNTIGNKYDNIYIHNTDDNENPYYFSIQGLATYGASPEIYLSGNNQPIASGSVLTNLANHTDFGMVTLNSTVSRSFTIQNTGQQELVITNITSSNPEFVINPLTIPLSLGALGNNGLTLTLNTASAGVKTTTITIQSNDVDEGFYTFVLQAVVVNTLPAQIRVFGNSIEIAKNALAQEADNTNFGITYAGLPITHSFMIQNTGTGILQVHDITLSNNTDFSVGNIILPIQIAVGGSASFTVTALYNTTGIKTSQITINNNDVNSSPFVFTLQNTIIKSAQAIYFNILPARILGDNEFNLVATTTSGLPVSFNSSNSNIASLSGNVVTIQGTGTCAITAQQTGNDLYLPATNVSQSLTIDLPTPDNFITKPDYAGWQPNNVVRDIKEDENYYYFGGEFTRMVKRGTSGAVGRGALVQTTGVGEVVQSIDVINGIVNIAISDGNGGVFIGGSFTKVGNVVRNGVAHIKADKSLDLLWNPNVTYTSPPQIVYALALSGNSLYIGGLFTSVGGQNRSGIARVSAIGTGEVDAWNPNATGSVRVIVVVGNEILVAGGFSNIGGASRYNLAKLSATTGLADNLWNPFSVYPSQSVNCMVVQDNNVYIGGSFGGANGLLRPRLAKVSLTGTGVCDLTWNPAPSGSFGEATGTINCLLFHEGKFYIAGDFTKLFDASISYLARLNMNGTFDNTWIPSTGSSNISISNDIRTLQMIGGKLYVGTSGDVFRLYTAPINSWLIDFEWRPNPSNGGVTAIASNNNNEVFIGGSFNFMGGIVRNRLARLHKNNLELDMTWNPSCNSWVNSITLTENEVFAGGIFSIINGVSRKAVAKISKSGVGVLDDSWNLNATIDASPWPTIHKIIVDNNQVYLGGSFSISGGVRNHIVKVNATGTGEVISTWNPVVNNWVFDMKMDNDKLIVAGLFTSLNNTSQKYLAKIDKNTGALDNTWLPNIDGSVNRLELQGTDLYIGGNFNNMAGQMRKRIAKLSTTSITPNAQWNPNIAQLDGDVGALVLHGQDLYVGGAFDNIGGRYRKNIAKLQASTGRADGEWNPTTDASVSTLHISNNRLFVSGVYRHIAEQYSPYFTIFSLLPSEIQLFGNNLLINDEEMQASIDKHTNFNLATINTPITNTFTIKNTGVGELTISQIVSSNSTDYTIAGITLPAIVSTGNSVTFQIIFKPLSVGYKTSVITIRNNDSNEGEYNFLVNGEGIKIPQTITFDALPTKTFEDVPFALTATASSNLTVTYSSSNTSVATISDNVVTIVGVGSTTITASQAGNSNYNTATAAQVLVVNKATQTITFNALPNKVPTDVPFALFATASSGLVVSYTSSDPTVATISGNTVTIVGVGTTTITASQVGNTNYNPATDVAQVQVVDKLAQTITFDALAGKAFGDVPFALSATASSGLTVSYVSSNTAVATVSGNMVTILGVGSTVITASQAGSSNYLSATEVAQTLIITKANQTLTFPTIADKVFGESPFALNATSSAGLVVNYSITTMPATGVATLSGNTIAIVGLGSVSVTASQAGNTNYNPATEVVRTFQILYPTNVLPNVTIAELVVYPNPSKSGIFEVRGLQSVDKTQVSYTVFDVSGKAVQSGVWAGKDVETLNLSAFANSVYTLTLQGSKIQTSKKVVKE